MSESTEIAHAIYYLASTVAGVGFLAYTGLFLVFLGIVLSKGRRP